MVSDSEKKKKLAASRCVVCFALDYGHLNSASSTPSHLYVGLMSGMQNILCRLRMSSPDPECLT